MLVSSILSQSWEGEEKSKLEPIETYKDKVTYLLLVFHVVVMIPKIHTGPQELVENQLVRQTTQKICEVLRVLPGLLHLQFISIKCINYAYS